MSRIRELYMDITVAGRNFERKDEILTLKPENTIEILDAYFAESKIEKVYEGNEEVYIVKPGDSLGSIASKKGTTIDAIIESDPNITAQNKSTIKVGQKIKLSSHKEKGEKITFKRINKASIGKEVYIIVHAKDFQSGSLKINIRQGKQEGIVAQDKVVPVTAEKKRKQIIEASVGSMLNSDYINKDDYSDMAIVKITLDPANKDDLKSWNDKLENLEGKKTNLYLLVDAHSSHTNKEVIYHGQNPDKNDKPDTSTKRNYWLDMDGKWFQLEGCLCCNMVVDEDGFINHKKINKNRIEALEKYDWKNDIQFIILHRTASQNKSSTLNSFKTGIGTHFFVDTDGAIYQTATLNKTTSHIRNGYNSKTIGIEVQGKSLDEDGSFSLGRANEKSVVGWEEVSNIQAEGIACLLKGLMEHLKLDVASIKNHEDLQAKTAMEGGKVYNAIIDLIK